LPINAIKQYFDINNNRSVDGDLCWWMQAVVRRRPNSCLTCTTSTTQGRFPRTSSKWCSGDDS